ncbi:ADP-glyceromanno-heptose 6-epimerase [Granulicella sp. 5B5]|uniref:ADP-glyceromanno-heptose 6-epimerase n=1 Tax=Granulicella sp. 5B5 TaxID=1617967 RepID=UPI0015F466D4|nr:ADP-glyceromanno-heptose 6-epimerase [Granulicella sp. 5B5]QMV17696.1 ADP-glyceromanno-heptose 6-epimerase [Granulicella sp. 5B5]
MARPIVVTGAAGFIGRNVVAELNRRGEDEIVLVDELGKDEKWKNLVGLRYEDIVSPEEFLGLLEDGNFADARSVIHMGACSSTTEKDADYLLRNNYQYTRVLANWCESHEVRFVYASSAATYGDGSDGYSDDDAVTPELRPLNMYGYSKQMFDAWALKQGLLSSIVGLKFFNVYGPHENHKGDMASMVLKSYEQIRCDGFVRLFKSYDPQYKDGEQLRDFVWVGDAVDVVLHFAEQEYGAPGGLFNCGTGKARTWNDLASAVFAAMGKEPKIEFIEMPEVLHGKYQYRTEAQMEKLRKAGYKRAFTSLEDGVREYVAFLERRSA